ncbi:unnamed protein product [Amoebophrya sp. A120]|nr:unnamed protein product [Amoebophrya sp. A120]|eukprot:GSA120T00012008001.1
MRRSHSWKICLKVFILEEVELALQELLSSHEDENDLIWRFQLGNGKKSVSRPLLSFSHLFTHGDVSLYPG